jgi:hypothetical protein
MCEGLKWENERPEANENQACQQPQAHPDQVNQAVVMAATS